MATDEEKSTELNKSRYKDEDSNQKTTSKPESEPNLAEYLIFLLIALFLDAAGVISDISVFLAIPIRVITLIPTLVFLLWRFMKGGKKIYLGGLAIMGVSETILSILPAYTCFVVYAWLKDSKLGKSTIGKISKLAKIKT